jgi:hypothetical protein
MVSGNGRYKPPKTKKTFNKFFKIDQNRLTKANKYVIIYIQNKEKEVKPNEKYQLCSNNLKRNFRLY